MEEEILSAISNVDLNIGISEVSGSSSSHTFLTTKQVKNNGTIPSKFKGVVPQQNGNWGAQIYANHQRIWLGTFKSENEAALAYDSAAINLRSGDSYRNFPWTNLTLEEPNFQSHHTTEAVLDMIRDGSYQSKFVDFLKIRALGTKLNLGLTLGQVHGNRGQTLKPLFQKELTPSDVGKLNRLVIPKKYAVKYFPPISENVEGDLKIDKVSDVQLDFFDRSMKLWRFRYCYWSSSQSFVFTRGWNRFVKEKRLKAYDTVVFYASEFGERVNIIDVQRGEDSNGIVDVAEQCIGKQIDLGLCLEPNTTHSEETESVEEGKSMEVKAMQVSEEGGFKLFGVHII